MPTSQTSDVIQHLRRAVLLRDHLGLTDWQLLGCFLEQRDEAAFAALVRRHGPMVWDVCRRVLWNDQDAEDAFQATFLVFARKAASVVPSEMLGNWLYGVAHQTALQARRNVVRRRTREKTVAAVPERAVAGQDPWYDLRPLLDEELKRLPDKYRVAIVLCDLEGKTRKEAARQLGWPEGTVAGRLARAREMLAKRLARRGVTLSGGVGGVASASVPGAVVASTIHAATHHATGTISAQVVILTQGVLNAMFLTKLKTAMVILAMLGAVTLTCGMLAGMGDGPAKGEPEKNSKKAAATTPDPKADALRRERKKFEGTWRGISTEVGGEKVEDEDPESVVAFDAEGRWKGRSGDGKLVLAGTSEIDLDAKPRSILLIVTSKGPYEGMRVHKIYEFLGADSYRTCTSPLGKGPPKEFSTKPGTGCSLEVLRRVEKQPAEKDEPDPKADALRRERKKFEGTWRVVSMEVNGKKQAEKDPESTITFDAEGRWKMQKGDGTTTGAGTSAIDLVAKPPSLHFTVTSEGDDERKTARRIYEFADANSLRTVPYQSEKDRPKHFSTRFGSGLVLFVWERVKKPTPNEIDAWLLDRLKKIEVKESKVPKEVLQNRVEAARRVYQQNLVRVQSGAGIPADLFGWSERWLESELAVCDTVSERVKALRGHRDRTRDVERITGTKARMGKGTQADADAAMYFRLEAEIRLYKEGVKPQPAKELKDRTAP